MNIQEKHERLLYPVVRIYSSKAAGSGTIIYSQPDPENEGEFLTFVLTNHHVIDDLISYKKEWDALLKRQVEKEFCDRAAVEVFSYVRQSTVDSSNRYRAEIVAYDKQHDLAILKLDSPRRADFVAGIIPEEKIKTLRLFQDIAVSGCTMAHEPFVTFGELTFLKEIIDQREYVMVNAGSYFGNSGGALFLKDTGELIGVPSRLTGIQLGFGVDMVTHMGFSAHPARIYQFLKEQELQFLFDDSDTYKAAMERRKRKQRDALLELKAELKDEVEEPIVG